MVINTNIDALTGLNIARRQDLSRQTALERMSSGKRINQGGDDPSGLAISSSMNSWTRGTIVANQNAQDTCSFLKTRDGSNAEAQDVLLRLRDLAVRAANDATLTNEDRTRLNNEASSLLAELARKNSSVTFNNKKVYDVAFQEVGPGNMNTLWQPGQVVSSVDLAALAAQNGGTAKVTGTWFDGIASFPDLDLLSPDGAEGFGWMFGSGNPLTANRQNPVNIESYVAGTGAQTVNKGDAALNAGVGNVPAGATMDSAGKVTYNGYDALNSETFQVTNPAPGMWKLVVDNETNATFKFGIFFNGQTPAWPAADPVSQVGAGNKVGTYTLPVGQYEISPTAMGLAVSLDTGDNARASIDSINKAMEYISNKRAADGAAEVRLNHIVNDNTAEIINDTASRSRIVDADMANEIVDYTKIQITTQSGQAMLAQANANPQSVMTILNAAIVK